MTGPAQAQLVRQTQFVLDANVFIAAWRDYYPKDVLPGFWDCLESFASVGTLSSIDKVRNEIESPEELVTWVRRSWNRAFASTEAPEIALAYSNLQQWVHGNDRFHVHAKEEFARVADGWLAAYALVNGCTLVTNEVYNPNTMRRVPLPNLCEEFNIGFCNTVEMLRRLGVQFDLRQSP